MKSLNKKTTFRDLYIASKHEPKLSSSATFGEFICKDERTITGSIIKDYKINSLTLNNTIIQKHKDENNSMEEDIWLDR